MKIKKTKCYLVDLHYYDDLISSSGHSHEITYDDVIIPCDLLENVVENEINECDVIIKDTSFMYIVYEC